MTASTTVADFMVTDIVTMAPGLEINKAAALLLEHQISGAPVVDETGEIAGILTTKDCFRAALNANYYSQWGGVVGDYMTHEVVTMDAGLDIVSAAEQFLARRFRLFPVLSEGELAGIVGRSDVLRAMIDVGKG